VVDLIEDLRFGVANDANMELQNEQGVVNGDNFDGRGRPERAQMPNDMDDKGNSTGYHPSGKTRYPLQLGWYPIEYPVGGDSDLIILSFA
jgi:hypothetical protein